MNKATIDIMIGDNETMRVDAYLSTTDGLALHRQVAYVPAKEEHKFTSKWQITHIPSGKALLKPSQCLTTLAQAQEVAESLSGHDWAEETPSEGSPAHKALLNALENTSAVEEGETRPIERRYIVRRNPEGAGYVVIDTATDTTVETLMHRGLASERAKELDGQVST